MAASMWRMNGLWRRIAGVLVLCTLLLSNEVICQDDITTIAPHITTGAPAADTSADAAAPSATTAPSLDAASPVAGGEDAAASAAPGARTFPVTNVNNEINVENQDGDTSGISGITVDPLAGESGEPSVVGNPDVKLVVPNLQCVGKEDIQESKAVKAEVATSDCEESKLIIQQNAAPWCKLENCNVEIFQDGNTLHVASNDAELRTLAGALQSEHLKDKLGVTKAEVPSSPNSSVFVGILVTGLLAALAITVGYCKCQRKSDTKGVRLAEEAYPVDQENQGNTLVSVAPLNPPPETQEKPSVNGESPEAAKTQPPPPTNGHSTAKTADTEL